MTRREPPAACRLPAATSARIERIRAAMQDRGRVVSRSEILREAIHRGLPSIECEVVPLPAGGAA